jgi:hypothetical protein
MRPLSPSLRLGAALLGSSLVAGLLVVLLLRRGADLQPPRGVAPLDLDEVPSQHGVRDGGFATELPR